MSKDPQNRRMYRSWGNSTCCTLNGLRERHVSPIRRFAHVRLDIAAFEWSNRHPQVNEVPEQSCHEGVFSATRVCAQQREVSHTWRVAWSPSVYKVNSSAEIERLRI